MVCGEGRFSQTNCDKLESLNKLMRNEIDSSE
jgi:hypothetical protein